MQFSTSDFADWNALLGHMTQSGSDTIIAVDAWDTITLKDVTASTLQQSQVTFK